MICLLLLTAFASGAPGATADLHTVLMHYTCKIYGPGEVEDTLSHGSAFLMTVPRRDNAEKGDIVLITATHVLRDIAGENATIALREKKSAGNYQPHFYSFPIRNGTTQLWTQHPVVDVSVIKITLPTFALPPESGIPIPELSILATDETFLSFEIHPGDEMFCLGFPNFSHSNFEFPILRSGVVSTYPLAPAEQVKAFLFDFEVFPGNSGGPVYFVDRGRRYGGKLHIDEEIRFIAGIVVRRHEELKLAIVVPAHYIEQTIKLLESHVNSE